MKNRLFSKRHIIQNAYFTVILSLAILTIPVPAHATPSMVDPLLVLMTIGIPIFYFIAAIFYVKDVKKWLSLKKKLAVIFIPTIFLFFFVGFFGQFITPILWDILDSSRGAERIPYGGRFAKHEYRNNGDGTVSDLKSGLMWQKAGSDALIYEEARAYVVKLNREQFGGYDDWRLPTTEELTDLVEPERQKNLLYISDILETMHQLWSSENNPRAAWYVSYEEEFGSLISVPFSYGRKIYARAVRNEKPGDYKSPL